MVDDDEMRRYRELRDVLRRLRAPDGCPWDRAQTHASLRPNLLQEAYEVLTTLDEGDVEKLPEELGDLLLQVLFHADIAEESGEFSMAGVLETVTDKLVRRHPHVFGDQPVSTPEEALTRWEDLKREERSAEASALQGVPPSLPALAYAQELLKRAGRVGFQWPAKEDVLVKVAEEVEELGRAESADERTAEFGDVLLNLANYARYIGIDAEEALRLASRKFRRRFEVAETLARSRAQSFADMPIEELLALWEEAKTATSR